MRRSRLEVRRGGIEGEGAARDLGVEAFLLRPLEATFPFRSIGACFLAPIVRRELAGILAALAMALDHNTPIKGHFWEGFCLKSHDVDPVQLPKAYAPPRYRLNPSTSQGRFPLAPLSQYQKTLSVQ